MCFDHTQDRPGQRDVTNVGMLLGLLDSTEPDRQIAWYHPGSQALSPRALAYRRDGHPARMAVVVQRLVRADCAGVMFTADPVTGDR